MSISAPPPIVMSHRMSSRGMMSSVRSTIASTRSIVPSRPESRIDRIWPDERVIAPVERLHEHEPGRLGGGDHLARLAGVGGDRLLAQHRLAGRERGQRPPVVERGGRGDVDRVDVGRLDELLVRPERLLDPPLVGRGLRPLERSRGDGHDVDAVDPRGRLDDRQRRDPGRRQESDAHRCDGSATRSARSLRCTTCAQTCRSSSTPPSRCRPTPTFRTRTSRSGRPCGRRRAACTSAATSRTRPTRRDGAPRRARSRRWCRPASASWRSC